jgi:hypothetical protein
MTSQADAGRTERSARTPAAPEPVRTEALAQIVSAAAALHDVNARAAVEAMKIPDARLDDAGDDGGAEAYTLRQSGVDDKGEPTYVKVDANGEEVKQKRADA